MGRIAVDDIRKGNKDESDQDILTCYYRSGSRYAIYRTPERVSLQYSDSLAEQKEQRKRLATLGPVRGEINGLIDGWRNLADKTIEQAADIPLTGKAGRNAAKVNRYDRRVADALLIALEGEDGPGAQALLEQIKADLIEERKSWARVLYVLYAAAAVGTLATLSGLISWFFPAKSVVLNSLWLALASGALGAFFSIAQAIRSRSVLTDLQMSGNIADAVLRVLVGSFSAVVLIALLISNLVGIQIGGGDFGLGDPCKPGAACVLDIWIIKIMLGGFIAGFLERLVPDLLQKASAAEAKDAPIVMPPPKPPAPAPVVPPVASPEEAPEAVTAPAPGDEASEPPVEDDATETEENCLTHAPVTDDEATPDDQLPPATGGVEKS